MKHLLCLILVGLFIGTLCLMPTVNAQEGTPKVTATTNGNLNVRAEPSTDAELLGSLVSGMSVEPLMRFTDDTNRLWLLIPFQYGRGWIAGWLVAIEGDVETLPVYGELTETMQHRFETESAEVPQEIGWLLEYWNEGRVILAFENDFIRVYETENFYRVFPFGVSNPLLEDPEVFHRLKIVILTEAVRIFSEDGLVDVTFEEVAADPEYYLSLKSKYGGTIETQTVPIPGRINTAGTEARPVELGRIAIGELWRLPFLWVRLGNVKGRFTNTIPGMFTSGNSSLGSFIARSESGAAVGFYFREGLDGKEHDDPLADNVTTLNYLELYDFDSHLRDGIPYEWPNAEDAFYILGGYVEQTDTSK